MLIYLWCARPALCVLMIICWPLFICVGMVFGVSTRDTSVYISSMCALLPAWCTSGPRICVFGFKCFGKSDILPNLFLVVDVDEKSPSNGIVVRCRCGSWCAVGLSHTTVQYTYLVCYLVCCVCASCNRWTEWTSIWTEDALVWIKKSVDYPR